MNEPVGRRPGGLRNKDFDGLIVLFKALLYLVSCTGSLLPLLYTLNSVTFLLENVALPFMKALHKGFRLYSYYTEKTRNLVYSVPNIIQWWQVKVGKNRKILSKYVTMICYSFHVIILK